MVETPDLLESYCLCSQRNADEYMQQHATVHLPVLSCKQLVMCLDVPRLQSLYRVIQEVFCEARIEARIDDVCDDARSLAGALLRLLVQEVVRDLVRRSKYRGQ